MTPLVERALRRGSGGGVSESEDSGRAPHQGAPGQVRGTECFLPAMVEVGSEGE